MVGKGQRKKEGKIGALARTLSQSKGDKGGDSFQDLHQGLGGGYAFLPGYTGSWEAVLH